LKLKIELSKSHRASNQIFELSKKKTEIVLKKKKSISFSRITELINSNFFWKSQRICSSNYHGVSFIKL